MKAKSYYYTDMVSNNFDSTCQFWNYSNQILHYLASASLLNHMSYRTAERGERREERGERREERGERREERGERREERGERREERGERREERGERREERGERREERGERRERERGKTERERGKREGQSETEILRILSTSSITKCVDLINRDTVW